MLARLVRALHHLDELRLVGERLRIAMSSRVRIVDDTVRIAKSTTAMKMRRPRIEKYAIALIMALRARATSAVLDVARGAAVQSARHEHHGDDLSHLRHELRTPLNHIIGFSEMLLEEAGDAGATAPVAELRCRCSRRGASFWACSTPIWPHRGGRRDRPRAHGGGARGRRRVMAACVALKASAGGLN